MGVLFTARLLQKKIKGGVGADGMHQTDVVVKSKITQSVQRIFRGEQRHIPRGALLRRVTGKLRTDAAAVQELLKITELAVNKAVALLLLRRDVGEL